MSDLISRSALEQSFDVGCVGECGCCKHHHCKHVSFGKWEDWCKLIKNAPAVDAVEVVRCRECIHRGTDECTMIQEDYYYDDDDGSDYVMRDYTEDDGFCHKGAKMDGGASDGSD